MKFTTPKLNLTVLMKLAAFLLAAQMPTFPVQAQTDFNTVCPNSSNVFPTNLPRRSLNRPWQQDYPILIFDEAAFNSEQKYRDLQNAVTTAEASLAVAQSQSNHKRDVATKAQAASRADGGSDLAKIAASADSAYEQAKQAADDALGVLDRAQVKLKAATAVAPQTYLYWKEANRSTLSPLPRNSFVGKVYLAEKVLILLCNARFGDGSSVNQTPIAVAGPETEELSLTSGSGPAFGTGTGAIDRIYVIDQTQTGNSLTMIKFSVPGKSDDNTPVTDVIATALVERHRIQRFSAGGGLLVTRATANVFSLITVPTVVTTTTAVSTTTTTPTSTTTVTSSTPTVAAGTAQYVLGSTGDNSQMNSIAGLTFYPFGHDTYPVTGRFTATYSFHQPWQALGIFAGTSVNTLGNFTVAPAFEVFPGVQVFGGATWWNNTVLLPGTVACSGYGTSPSYATLPIVTSTSSNMVTGSPSSTMNSTTTTSVSAISGCANGDKATIFSGSTVPTRNTIQQGWGFGVLFNSNLLSAFKGLAGK